MKLNEEQQKLAADNFDYANACARKVTRDRDLWEVAPLALCKAVASFHEQSCSLKTWIYACVRNAVLDAARKKKRDQHFPLPYKLYAKDDETAHIFDALPEDLREIAIDKYIYNYTYAEMQKRHGVSAMVIQEKLLEIRGIIHEGTTT